MNATLALQTALRMKLLAAPQVTALLGPAAVFDDVPQGARCPYLPLGDIETRDWSTQTREGHEHSVTLHVWTDYRGRKQALDIIEAVDAVLEQPGLALAGHAVVNLRTTFWTVLHELGNGLYHGIMRLRVVTEPNTQGE